VRAETKTPNVLHVVKDADHSLRLPKRVVEATGETQDEIDSKVLAAITEFVRVTLLATRI
jgi:hypothetical protein